MLLPVMHNDMFYTNTMERKKRGKITSLPVPSLPVTWLPFMSYPLTMLLPVMRNCTFRTTIMVRKKRGNVQNILPAMTSFPVTWHHVTSFPVRAASGYVTSSNACAMARSPLLPPKDALSCPDIQLRYWIWGDPINNPWKNIAERHSSFPLRV